MKWLEKISKRKKISNENKEWNMLLNKTLDNTKFVFSNTGKCDEEVLGGYVTEYYRFLLKHKDND